MSSLINQQIDLTYEGLIKTFNEQPLSVTPNFLQDGAGNNLPFEVGTGDTNFFGNVSFANATVTGLPASTDTTYDYGAAGAAGNILMALTGSDATNDVVTMQAGTNITLTDNGTNTFTIDATSTPASFSDDVNESMFSNLTSIPATVTNNGANAIAIGYSANVNGGNGGVSIGANTIGGEGSTVIGFNAQNGDIYGTAIGSNTRGGYFGAALGYGAFNGSNFSVAVGGDSNTETDYGIAIGNNASSRAQYNISIGVNSLVDDAVRVNTVVIGSGAGQTKAAQYSTAVGSQSLAVADLASAFGYQASANFTGSSAIGANTSSVANDTVTVKRLHWQDYASVNFPDDAQASANGIPLGGLYHNNGIVQIRIV